LANRGRDLALQYARIVKNWITKIGLNSLDYGINSLRRTKAILIYKRTKNLRAIQLLLGHTKLESTVRYLDIEVDDALELAEQTEVLFLRRGSTNTSPYGQERALATPK